MNKRSWLMKLMAFTVVLTMMFGFVGVVYSEALDVTAEQTDTPEEVTLEAPEGEPEVVSEPEAPEEPEVSEPETPEEPEQPEESEQPVEPEEPEQPVEDEPESTVVTELETEAETQIEETPDDDEDDEDFDFDDEDEDFDDGNDIEEFDDDEVGDVSEDLLEQFNNPDSFEQIQFSGSADIQLDDDVWADDWDGTVTLIAQVQDASLSYRLVWEANDGDSRGWFTVGSGNEYSYTLTKDNVAREANRQYRVVMFTID